MKMEKINSPIAEFIGLRSKMYSLLFANGKEFKKAKGIVSSVTKNVIKHDNYRKTLDEKYTLQRSKMNVIRSEKHQLYTMAMNKISLSAYDDKRYILSDGVNSYAYGHHRIAEHRRSCPRTAHH